MTTELTMLVYATVLLLVLVGVQAFVALRAQGAGPLAGSRDDLPPPTPLQARTKRIVDNHREGLTIFAPLILVAALAHVSNRWTVLGSELFFYSRVAHAGLYLFAVPYLRSVAFAVGLIGTVMVLAAVI